MITLIPGKTIKESIKIAADNLQPNWEDIERFLNDLIDILYDEMWREKGIERHIVGIDYSEK